MEQAMEIAAYAALLYAGAVLVVVVLVGGLMWRMVRRLDERRQRRGVWW